MKLQIPGPVPNQMLDLLEPRALLAAAALPHTLYYPEGYAHDQISEFVPITNPNNNDVSFELYARYETGERDQLLASGVIPANTRSGVTINVAGDDSQRLVRKDQPFALVLSSSDIVDATISHYDFGATIGQSFTDEPSTTWTFTNVQNNHANVRDFLVFYNTTESRANVSIKFLADSGETYTLTRTLGALRRGGVNVDAERSIPEGTYAVTITSDQPIVAALSHYDVSNRRGFGVLGAANGGGLAGIIPAVDFQDNDRGHGNDPDGLDDDNPGHGHRPRNRPFATETSFNVLNTNDASATVTFTFLAHQGSDDLPTTTRSVTVPGNSRLSVIFDDLGFSLGDDVGVTFQSDQVVTVAAMISGPRRAAAIPAITTAATQWGFGEGFLTRERAGRTITEDLFIFNPAATDATVTIEFLFRDGSTFTTTQAVGAGAIVDLSLDQISPLLDHIDRRYFFGMRVSAADPIVATLDHLDRVLAGGFTTAGIPRGTVVPLSDVYPPVPTPGA